MIRLLAIETSSEACSVALSVGGGQLESHEHAPLRHAELLLPAVERLLAEGDVRLGDLDAIAFGRGPGSFTSLRIGIGVVQGLAWAASLPVAPQSSLAALALEAAESAPAPDGARIRVAVDARMQEVFTADFDWRDGQLREGGDERVCAPGSAARPDGVERPFVAVGNGFARFEELAALGRTADFCLPERWPRALLILRLAEAWLQDHEPLPPALAQPVYIRDRVAEKPPAD